MATDKKENALLINIESTFKEEDEDPEELERITHNLRDDLNEEEDKAIKINPRFAVAYNTKGSALFNLRQYQEALVCYEKALELRPKYIEAINNKGLALSLTGKYDKSIECFNQSTDLNPNDAVIWNYKGVALHALGKYEDAIASYDKAINLRSNYIEALNNRGFSYSYLKKTEEQSPQHSEVEVAKEVKQPPVTPPSTAPITQPTPQQPSTAPITQPPSTAPITQPPSTAPASTPSSQPVSQQSSVPPVRSVPFGKYSDSIDESVPEKHEVTIHKGYTMSKTKILIPILVGVVGIVLAIGLWSTYLCACIYVIPPPSNQSTTPPTAKDQSVTTSENTPVAIKLGVSDPNPNVDLLATIVTQPSKEMVSSRGIGITTSHNQGFVVIYTPYRNFNGTDSFTFQASDGKVDSNIATVTITVAPDATLAAAPNGNLTAPSNQSSVAAPNGNLTAPSNQSSVAARNGNGHWTTSRTTCHYLNLLC